MDYDPMDSELGSEYIQLVFAQICDDIYGQKYLFHDLETRIKAMAIPLMLTTDGIRFGVSLCALLLTTS